VRVGVLRVQDHRRRHVPEVVVVELLAGRLRAIQKHSCSPGRGCLPAHPVRLKSRTAARAARDMMPRPAHYAPVPARPHEVKTSATAAPGVRMSAACEAPARACVSAGSTAATGGNISCTSALTATSVDQLDVATADDALRSSPARRGRHSYMLRGLSASAAARPRRSAASGLFSGPSAAVACNIMYEGQKSQRLSRTLGVDDEDLGGGDADGEVADLVGVPVAKARVERVVLRREQRADVLTPATTSLQLHVSNL